MKKTLLVLAMMFGVLTTNAQLLRDSTRTKPALEIPVVLSGASVGLFVLGTNIQRDAEFRQDGRFVNSISTVILTGAIYYAIHYIVERRKVKKVKEIILIKNGSWAYR